MLKKSIYAKGGNSTKEVESPMTVSLPWTVTSQMIAILPRPIFAPITLPKRQAHPGQQSLGQGCDFTKKGKKEIVPGVTLPQNDRRQLCRDGNIAEDNVVATEGGGPQMAPGPRKTMMPRTAITPRKTTLPHRLMWPLRATLLRTSSSHESGQFCHGRQPYQ